MTIPTPEELARLREAVGEITLDRLESYICLSVIGPCNCDDIDPTGDRWRPCEKHADKILAILAEAALAPPAEKERTDG